MNNINFNSNSLIDIVINEVGSNFKNCVDSYYKLYIKYDNNDFNNYMEMVFDELEDVGIIFDGNINFNDNYYNNFSKLFDDVKNNKYFGNYRLGKVVLDFIINSSSYSNCSCYYNESNFKDYIDRDYKLNLYNNDNRGIVVM